jgi:hypothetical protein
VTISEVNPMTISKALLWAGALVFLAAPLHAGIWDDLKEGVDSARDIIDDVDETRGTAKDAVGDAKGIAEETSEDIGSAVPEPEAGAPPPPSAVSAPPPPSAREWRIDVGGGQTRTVGQGELAEMIRTGEVGRDTFVWTQDLGDWTAAGEVSSLAAYFSE